MDWYNDQQAGYEVDSWKKIQKMRKEKKNREM